MDRLLEHGRKRHPIFPVPDEPRHDFYDFPADFGGDCCIRLEEIFQDDPALAITFSADLMLDLESPEALQEDVRSPVGEALHVQHPAAPAHREDRRGTLVIRFPTLL